MRELERKHLIGIVDLCTIEVLILLGFLHVFLHVKMFKFANGHIQFRPGGPKICCSKIPFVTLKWMHGPHVKSTSIDFGQIKFV